MRDHRIRRTSGVQAPAPLRPRAPRVPRLRLGRHRPPRGGRARVHAGRRQPPEPEARRRRQPSPATTGLGHTRWATHGGVTEQNAHPLAVEDPRSSRSCSTASSRTTASCASGSRGGSRLHLRDGRRDRHPPDPGALRRRSRRGRRASRSTSSRVTSPSSRSTATIRACSSAPACSARSSSASAATRRSSPPTRQRSCARRARCTSRGRRPRRDHVRRCPLPARRGRQRGRA